MGLWRLWLLGPQYFCVFRAYGQVGGCQDVTLKGRAGNRLWKATHILQRKEGFILEDTRESLKDFQGEWVKWQSTSEEKQLRAEKFKLPHFMYWIDYYFFLRSDLNYKLVIFPNSTFCLLLFSGVCIKMFICSISTPLPPCSFSWEKLCS